MIRRIISRPVPDKLPETPLPLYVRSVGYNEAVAGWSEFFPASGKMFVQLFWGLKGEGDFEIRSRRHRLKSGEIIYRLPGEDHIHAAASPIWTYHWFTLDGPLATEFIKGYGYPQRPMPAGPCPTGLFLQLEGLMREMSPRSQRSMLGIAMEILAKAGNGAESRGDAQELVTRFIKLAGSRFQDPLINVSSLAEELGIHRTTLDRAFKREMRINPCEYLAGLRVQKALSLLRETELPACKVGELAGIPNRGYFCKVVRKAIGMTPKAYREQVLEA